MVRVKSWYGACALICACAAGLRANADEFTWDGEGVTDDWSNPFNWNPDAVPGPGDAVVHPTADTIHVDVGTFLAPWQILSFDATGGGTLVIDSGKGLQVSTHFLVSNPPYTLTLQYGVAGPSALDVQGRFNLVGNFTAGQDCLANFGAGGVPRGTWGGHWIIRDGAQLTFSTDVAPTTSPGTFTVELRNGGATPPDYSLKFTECPNEQDTVLFTSAIGDDQPRQLLFEGTGNVIRSGALNSSVSPQLQLGYHTVVKPSDNPPGTLIFNTFSGFEPRSFFAYDFVRENWDSRQVDILVEPIPDSIGWAGDLRYGMISPDLLDYYPEGAVIFLDIPCVGTLRDFTLADGQPGETISITRLYDEYENAYIDNFPSYPDFSGKREQSFYRNVYIGSGRRLLFEAPTLAGQSRFYYYGTLEIVDEDSIYLGGEVATPEQVADLIRPAQGTLYGDWDGDCALENSELADLMARLEDPELYTPLEDSNCDGVLTRDPDLLKFLENMSRQPECGQDGGAMGMGLDPEGEALAASVADQLKALLTAQELSDFMLKLEGAAAKFGGTAVGDEMLALLSYLK